VEKKKQKSASGGKVSHLESELRPWLIRRLLNEGTAGWQIWIQEKPG